MATERIRFINKDASGAGTGLTEADAYTTSTLAEAGEQGDISSTTGSDEWVNFVCFSTAGTIDTSNLVISGWTFEIATGNFLQLTGQTIGHEWDATNYRAEASSGNTINFNEDFIKIVGLQIGNSSTGRCITGFQSGVADFEMSRCIFRCSSTQTFGAAVVIENFGAAGSVTKIRNSLLFNSSGTGNATIKISSANVDVSIMNNTFETSARGILWGTNADYHVFNNLFDVTDSITSGPAKDNTKADFNYSGENTDDGLMGDNGAFNQTFTYENAAGEDWRITAGSPGENDGKDLSSDTDLPVTIDVLATARPQGAAYDVGFFEIAVASSSISNRAIKNAIRLGL